MDTQKHNAYEMGISFQNYQMRFLRNTFIFPKNSVFEIYKTVKNLSYLKKYIIVKFG